MELTKEQKTEGVKSVWLYDVYEKRLECYHCKYSVKVEEAR